MDIQFTSQMWNEDEEELGDDEELDLDEDDLDVGDDDSDDDTFEEAEEI